MQIRYLIFVISAETTMENAQLLMGTLRLTG
jgi:hypothetical protein